MPNGEITVTPTQLSVAVGIERFLTVGGQITQEGIGEGLEAEWFEPIPTGVEIDETARSINNNNTFPVTVETTLEIPAQQAFSIRGTIGDFTDEFDSYSLGVRDNTGAISAFFTSLVGFDVKFHLFLFGQMIVSNRNGSAMDGFVITSNGSVITAYRVVGSNNIYIGQAVIPASVTNFRYSFNIPASRSITNVFAVVNQAVINLNTSNIVFTIAPSESAEIRIVDVNNYGIKVLNNENRLITLAHEGVESRIIPVVVESLFLRPTDRPSGSYALQGEVIQFESNGGEGGEFVASAGTVLDGLKWQAPLGVGVVDFTYTVGNITAIAQLTVVPLLEVAGIKHGFYPNVMQGDTIQFYPSIEGSVFSSPNYPFVILPNGQMNVSTDAEDEFFGWKEVVIVVRGGGQIFTFKVIIEPLFPIPMFCGASPKHWIQLRRDFLPTTLEMDGGARQKKNRNRFGVISWRLEYELLRSGDNPACDCPIVAGHFICAEKLQNAKRLDAFYLFVTTVRKFSVIDYHSRERFKGVTLEAFENDYVIYEEQSRRIEMYLDGKPEIIIQPFDDDTNQSDRGEGLVDGQVVFEDGLIVFYDKPLVF